MYRVRAWYPLGGRHPLEHYQRYSKRSVPNDGWCNRVYSFRYRLLRLHPLVIHSLKRRNMKGTDHFKRMIQMYLEQRAAEDELFAKNYRNPAKNIDDCVTYILNYVQKSGCNGFSDGEIYGQAVHYYDENEIEVGNPLQCHVAVNHVVELTAEEKAEARQNAIRQYQNEELRRLQSRNKPNTTAKKETNVQPTLFDF